LLYDGFLQRRTQFSNNICQRKLQAILLYLFSAAMPPNFLMLCKKLFQQTRCEKVRIWMRKFLFCGKKWNDEAYCFFWRHYNVRFLHMKVLILRYVCAWLIKNEAYVVQNEIMINFTTHILCMTSIPRKKFQYMIFFSKNNQQNIRHRKILILKSFHWKAFP
jgi:hypothetical protein